MACPCCQPQNCPGLCAGIDSRGFPDYLQLEISNFSGSLGDYAISPNGTYTVPTIHISCNIYPLGQTCPSPGQDCGVYQIFLDKHNSPSQRKQCCGGFSGKDLSPTPYIQPDMSITISNYQRMPNVDLGSTLAVYYDGLVSCCDSVVGFWAGAKWTYSNAEWISLLCSRTLDLSGTATGAYGYRQVFPPTPRLFGSVSFNYRITVNDLP